MSWVYNINEGRKYTYKEMFEKRDDDDFYKKIEYEFFQKKGLDTKVFDVLEEKGLKDPNLFKIDWKNVE
jgi:adenine specific DNA methylase Mod